jgi:hypothetical protein
VGVVVVAAECKITQVDLVVGFVDDAGRELNADMRLNVSEKASTKMISAEV